MKVQTIDFQSKTAGADFVSSLHGTGFAILRNHPIPRDLLDSIYTDWAAFFAGDDKHSYSSDVNSDHGARTGFFPIQVSETAVDHSTKDLKEFFQVMPGEPIPAGCKERILQYRAMGFDLGAALLKWLQQFTPQTIKALLSEPFTGMISDDSSMLRILHYPPLAGVEEPGAVRAAPHEDINLLTILPVAEQPGLQVKDNTGSWIDVAGNEGEIVVNSGDMLQEATNGYYPSASHRVLNPGVGVENISRISLPLFLTPALDVVLSDRYTSGSYLDERLRLIHR